MVFFVRFFAVKKRFSWRNTRKCQVLNQLYKVNQEYLFTVFVFLNHHNLFVLEYPH